MDFEVKILHHDNGKVEDVPTPVEKQFLSKGVPIFNPKGFRGMDYVNIKNIEDEQGFKWQICVTIDNRL